MPNTDQLASNSDALTAYRLSMIEKTQESMEKTQAAMAENLTKLTTLELKYQEGRDATNRLFIINEKTEARLVKIELELPTLTMVRGWVIAGATSMLGVFGLFLFNTITKG